jgi:hypothetical protein
MVDVYWACTEKEGLRATEPTSILKKYYSTHKTDNNSEYLRQNSCPAFNSAMKNMYGLHSIYDYSFKLMDKKTVGSPMYDDDFFNDHVIVRSLEEKFFSFIQSYIFFSEEPLLMRSYIYPFLENNEVAKRTYSIPGEFDIGQWFRELEFNFYLKDEYDEFVIKDNEIYTYIQFMTNEKINLKRFYISDKMRSYIYDLQQTRFNKVQNSSLSFFYNFFNNSGIKKLLLEEIKNNII